VSTEGNALTLFYRDPAVNFSDFTVGASVNQSSIELDQYQRNNIINAYTKREQLLRFSPGYKITPTLELAALLNYTDKRYEEIAPFTSVPGNYWSYGAGARLTYVNADYKLYYNDGVSTNIQWLRQIHRSDTSENVSQASLRFEWDTLLFYQQALQLAVQAANLTDNGNAGDILTYGRVKGYRGINPDGLWTRRVVTASVDYQIPVKRIYPGIFTVAPFLDYGMYQPVSPATGSNYAAYGVGGYLFINAISLPGAIGILIGHNEAFMGNFISFQLGYAY